MRMGIACWLQVEEMRERSAACWSIITAGQGSLPTGSNETLHRNPNKEQICVRAVLVCFFVLLQLLIEAP